MQRWEQSYSLLRPGTVLVDQHDGMVRIVGWDQEIVQVVATSAEPEPIAERLEVSVDGDRLRIEVSRSNGGLFGFLNRDSRLDLELYVPLGTACHVDSGSGPVLLEQTAGRAEVDTGSGPVTAFGLTELKVDAGSGAVQARQIDGPVTVDTGSGRIDLETVRGPVLLDAGSGAIAARRIASGLEASTGSGSITLSDVEGPIDLEAGSGAITVNRIFAPSMSVETGSGAIRLQSLDVHALQAETGSGSVEVELAALYPTGSYRIETGSGRVAVEVPPESGLRFQLRPGRRVDYGGLPVQIQRQEDDQVLAQLGDGGGPLLSVMTKSGSIRLRAGQASYPGAESGAVARLAELVKEEPTLDQGEQLTRILQMVRDGRLSTEEAAEILRALEGEEAKV